MKPFEDIEEVIIYNKVRKTNKLRTFPSLHVSVFDFGVVLFLLTTVAKNKLLRTTILCQISCWSLLHGFDENMFGCKPPANMNNSVI